MKIAREEFMRLLNYNADTGKFTWRVNRGRLAKAGNQAGQLIHGKYHCIKVVGRFYMAHRLAWLFVHGEWPKHQIDHINGIKDDNRISNLRDVPKTINQQNVVEARKDSATGYRGVHPKGSRFVAAIRKDGKRLDLGYFATAESARDAYIAAKSVMHPEAALRHLRVMAADEALRAMGATA